MDPLITLIIVLVIVGAVVYLVDHLPIDATFKLVIRVIAIVALVIYALNWLRGSALLR